MTTTINFTTAAQENIEETGIDPQDDIAAVRAGAKSATSLLDECLKGADRDRVQGWRDYVDAVVAAARTEDSELSAYALLTARDNNCDRPAAVRMMADEIGEVSRETGVDEDAVRAWIRAQG